MNALRRVINGRRQTADGRQQEQASAFIISLGILVILFIMAITFTTMMRMESQAARNYSDAVLCEEVARGALEEAINALFRDKYGEDASMVGGSLVLEPYNDDEGDENWDAWRYEGDPDLDDTLWFKSDGGWLSEDASNTNVNLREIKDAGKSWPTAPDLWQDATEQVMVQVAGQMRLVESNNGETLTVVDGTGEYEGPFDAPGPQEGDRYIVFFWFPRDASDNPIVKHLAGGLSGRYAILITDDREAKANVNSHGNRNAAGNTQGQNQGVNTYEVSLEDVLTPFGASGKGGTIIANRVTPPGGGTTEPGASTLDDDPGRDSPTGRPPVNENAVDDDADGTVDNEPNPLVDEDDEFNPLDPKDDTPYALPQEIDLIQDDSAFTSRLEGFLSDAELRTNLSTYSADTGSAQFLYKCLTTYSAGTMEHPYFDPGTDGVDNDGDTVVDEQDEEFWDYNIYIDTLGYDLRRYRFGLNEFDPTKDKQIDDLVLILRVKGGFSTTDPTKPDPYQFIVNLKDAMDGDTVIDRYTPDGGTTNYYGVEASKIIFITEVFVQDLTPPGGPQDPDKVEYAVELFNPTSADVDINNWVLSTVRLGGTSLNDFTAFSVGTTISAGDYLIISNFNSTELTALVTANKDAGGTAVNHDIDLKNGALEFRYDGSGTAIGDVISLREDTYDLVIDKADLPAVTQGTSQERRDWRVDEWNATTDSAGHTLGADPDGGYLTDGPPDRFHILTAPMTWYGKDITYDMKFANLGDLGRLLLVGLIPDPITTDPTEPALSQYFKQVKDAIIGYEDIKFDISHASHRAVLDYLTILNPMGDDYDDDGDGEPDDIGPDDSGFVGGKTDLGGPEHRILGMININTAYKEVLAALPGVDATLAQAIIDNRPYTQIGDLLKKDVGGNYLVTGIGALGSNTADDNGNLIDDEKEEEYLIFGAISNIVTTRSNVFTVYSLAQVGMDVDGDDKLESPEDKIFAERKLMAIVDRSTQPITVRFFRWLSD